MKSAFQKISRVPSLSGGTRWYLSDDCLLSAKRLMYTVEYRRFYLRDIESIVVWPNSLWKLRVIIPTAFFVIVGGLIWTSSNTTVATIGMVLAAMGVAWLARELALGPTANARIRTTGTTVELPLVRRTRRAQRVLARIDEAVRATRGAGQQDLVSGAASASPSASSAEATATRAGENTALSSDLIPDATQTSGS